MLSVDRFGGACVVSNNVRAQILSLSNIVGCVPSLVDSLRRVGCGSTSSVQYRAWLCCRIFMERVGFKLEVHHVPAEWLACRLASRGNIVWTCYVVTNGMIVSFRLPVVMGVWLTLGVKTLTSRSLWFFVVV